MDQPLITIYKPQQQGDRWIARADIQARGEQIELQATASNSLASRAQNLYNRASNWLAQYMRYEPSVASFGQRREAGPDYAAMASLSTGVFGDLPLPSWQLATARAIPYDEDVREAVAKVRRAGAGDPIAIDELNIIVQDAATGDPDARDARETVELVLDAIQRPEQLDMPRVFRDAAKGEPKAKKTIAALKEVLPCEQPTRLTWSMDEYESLEVEELGAELLCACGDEIGARLAEPWLASMFITPEYIPAGTAAGRVRLVRPGWDSAMVEAYQGMLAGPA